MRRMLLALIMVATTWSLCVGGASAQPMATDAMVTGAKTAAAHEALAAQYDKDAAAAKAKAAEHTKMGEAYKGQAAVTGGKVSGISAMPQHCASLAKSYEEQARMYTSMAAVERELAKTAK